jgi:hypothetical protein
MPPSKGSGCRAAGQGLIPIRKSWLRPRSPVDGDDLRRTAADPSAMCLSKQWSCAVDHGDVNAFAGKPDAMKEGDGAEGLELVPIRGW